MDLKIRFKLNTIISSFFVKNRYCLPTSITSKSMKSTILAAKFTGLQARLDQLHVEVVLKSGEASAGYLEHFDEENNVLHLFTTSGSKKAKTSVIDGDEIAVLSCDTLKES